MSNGNGESRLDRIERMLERLALAQETQREDFDRELKALLAAQVVLTDRMDTLTIAQAETTEKLNALIDGPAPARGPRLIKANIGFGPLLLGVTGCVAV